MDKNRWVCAGALVVLMAAVCIFACGQTASAQECRIVKISGEGVAGQGKIILDPEIITIAKDTCIVWFNRARTTEVKVKFADGKKCDDVTTAGTGFELDAAECFVTSYIPFAGTSSLNFLEVGTYDYVVESKMGAMAKGKIVVE